MLTEWCREWLVEISVEEEGIKRTGEGVYKEGIRKRIEVVVVW